MRRILLPMLSLLIIPSIFGIDFKVVVPQLSPTSTEAYQRLITAVLAETGNTATIQVLPFARCVYLIETKQAQILSEVVAIPDQRKWADLKFDYATSALNPIVFVLYYNRNKPINIADLKAGKASGLKLETETSHVNHFGFPVSPSSNVDGSLKKVDSGDIDGYLFSQGSGDVVLRRLGLKNVRRAFFDTFTGAFVIQKGERGRQPGQAARGRAGQDQGERQVQGDFGGSSRSGREVRGLAALRGGNPHDDTCKMLLPLVSLFFVSFGFFVVYVVLDQTRTQNDELETKMDLMVELVATANEAYLWNLDTAGWSEVWNHSQRIRTSCRSKSSTVRLTLSVSIRMRQARTCARL
ncbi:MAG: hypothetical protein HC888_19580 [Candidatus Competibacteraceae bacterium]|nr:hypothetical protein [Candidatus Competibacteraceae bacterium]